MSAIRIEYVIACYHDMDRGRGRHAISQARLTLVVDDSREMNQAKLRCK